MRAPVLRLHADELIIDSFAGGGGASAGIEMATGRSPDIAVNHDHEALAMHAANHPKTKHLCENVWKVDPRKVCKGRKVGLAWFSPDCTFHSKARGGKPFRDRNKARRRRGLAWVVVKWAKEVRPRVIFLENVEEFQKWGPVDGEGKIIAAKQSITFHHWIARLRNLDYQVEWRELRACDYGAPTTRNRLYVIARCDGLPIAWPTPTHGDKASGLLPFRTAAECIDFTVPCPSIFLTKAEAKRLKLGIKRPLAANTLARIARGIQKYLIDAADPFLVPVAHAGDERAHSIHEPMRTITGAHRGEHAVVAPTIARLGQTGGNGSYVNAVEDPLTTVTTKAEHMVVAPHLVRTAHGEQDSTGKKRGRGEHAVDAPLPTVLTTRDFAVTAPILTQYHSPRREGDHRTQPLDTPLPTQDTSNRFGLVAPTLIQSGYGERKGQEPRTLDILKPLGTIISGGTGGNGKHAVVEARLEPEQRDAAFLAQHYGGNYDGPGLPLDGPTGTITTQDHHAVIASNLVKLQGDPATHPQTAQDARDPLGTVMASGFHYAEVRTFLKAYSAANAKLDEKRAKKRGRQLGLFEGKAAEKAKRRWGVVNILGVDYIIADIGMRMLQPRELFNAQGFPANYIIRLKVAAVVKRGKRKGQTVMKWLSKEGQIRMCGNSVCPPMAAALITANFAEPAELAATG